MLAGVGAWVQECHESWHSLAGTQLRDGETERGLTSYLSPTAQSPTRSSECGSVVRDSDPGLRESQRQPPPPAPLPEVQHARGPSVCQGHRRASPTPGLGERWGLWGYGVGIQHPCGPGNSSSSPCRRARHGEMGPHMNLAFRDQQ